MSGTKRPIGELLVVASLVTEEQVEDALERQRQQGGKIVESLVALGHLDYKTFSVFMAQQPGVAALNLSDYDLNRKVVDTIPRDFATKHDIFPIDRLGKLLTVGMAFPLDQATIEELEGICGLRVKPLLCSAGDIQAAIRKYYPEEALSSAAETGGDQGVVAEHLESSLRISGLADILSKIDNLPVLSETVQKIERALHDPEVSIKEVAAVIGTDPPLAAKLVSITNSSAFGLPQQVDSVDLAAAMLGLRETYLVAVSASVLDTFEDAGDFDYSRYWADSHFCASIAVTIAKARGLKRASTFHTAALLHDIGRLALAVTVPERYGRIDPALNGSDLVAAEMEAFGLAHPEAGYLLATSWNLPPEITEPIRFHHSLEHASEAKEIVATTQVAYALQLAYDAPTEEAMGYLSASKEAMAVLGLAGQTVVVLRDVIKAYAP